MKDSDLSLQNIRFARLRLSDVERLLNISHELMHGWFPDGTISGFTLIRAHHRIRQSSEVLGLVFRQVDLNDLQNIDIKWLEDRFDGPNGILAEISVAEASQIRQLLEVSQSCVSSLQRKLSFAWWAAFARKCIETLATKQFLFAFILLAVIATGLAYLQTARQVWTIKYFPDGSNLLHFQTATSRNIDFDWGGSPPVENVPGQYFSAEFYSCFESATLTRFKLLLGSDDGSRLWLNGEPIIENFEYQMHSLKSTEINIPPGKHVLRIQYFQGVGGASLSLEAKNGPEQTKDFNHYLKRGFLDLEGRFSCR